MDQHAFAQLMRGAAKARHEAARTFANQTPLPSDARNTAVVAAHLARAEELYWEEREAAAPRPLDAEDEHLIGDLLSRSIDDNASRMIVGSEVRSLIAIIRRLAPKAV